MDEQDVSDILWENVQALMRRDFGRENVTGFGNATGIAPAGAQRIKYKRDVGVKLLARVAKHFELDVWQLLAPNLGASMLLSDTELEAVRKLRNPIQPRGTNVAPLPPPPDSGVLRIPKMPSKKKTSNPKRRSKRA